MQKTKQPKIKPNPQDLGFGKYFTDHMFLLDFEQGKGWHSPRIEPYQSLSLDPAASALHYGQTMFEGMKAFRSAKGDVNLFRPDYHVHRMVSGASRLCLPEPPAEMMLEAVKELVRLDQDWVPSTKGSAMYIRPTLIGTEPFLGVRPSEKSLFYIIMSPVGSYYKEGAAPVKIWVEDEHVRAAPGGLGAVKAGANYVAGLAAALKAKKKGYTQVLWMDAVERKYLEEVGTMNVFFRLRNEIVTPPLSGTILAGATRDCAIQILQEWGINIRERQISIQEVMAAHADGQLQEVFGTGTAAVISPVGELMYKGQQMIINGGKIGEMAAKLHAEISGIQYGEREDRHHWLTKI